MYCYICALEIQMLWLFHSKLCFDQMLCGLKTVVVRQFSARFFRLCWIVKKLPDLNSILESVWTFDQVFFCINFRPLLLAKGTAKLLLSKIWIKKIFYCFWKLKAAQNLFCQNKKRNTNAHCELICSRLHGRC